MTVFKSKRELQEFALNAKRAGKRIGLVPTMGYLHAGHTSLIDIAREKSDIVIVSIFVNPTQFAPTEDLDRYPRDFAHDLELCREHRADAIFAPEPGEMYDPDASTWVTGTFVATVTEHDAAFEPSAVVHVTTAIPMAFAVISPDAGSTDTTDSLLDDQITSLSVASVGVILALRLAFSPNARVMDSGDTVIPVTGIPDGATVTRQDAVFVPPPAVHNTTASPEDTAVISPVVGSTVTTDSSLDDQVTVLSVAFTGLTVTTRVHFSPSLSATSSLDNVTPLTSTAFCLTVTWQVAVRPISSDVTVIRAIPAETALTTPWSDTSATFSSLLDQNTFGLAALDGNTAE